MTKSIASGDLARRPLATPFEVSTLICFSHLRWDFVYQRPQHLMSRFARQGRVFYEAHGHSERIYAMKPMLEHILAGVQYAIGDLKADDSPSRK